MQIYMQKQKDNTEFEEKLQRYKRGQSMGQMTKKTKKAKPEDQKSP